MSAQRKIENHLMSESEYFALLEKGDKKLEWIGGEVRSMAGGSSNHSTISTRIAVAINGRLGLESPCEARVSDLKVRVEAANANYFPDVVLFCEDATFDQARPDWLLTPLLIFEVLSDSTERVDREEKLLNYRQIPSLRHYLLVSQRRVLVEHYHLDENQHWISDIYNWGHQEIFIDFLNVRIPVEEIYRRLNIPESMVIVQEEAQETQPETEE